MDAVSFIFMKNKDVVFILLRKMPSKWQLRLMLLQWDSHLTRLGCSQAIDCSIHVLTFLSGKLLMQGFAGIGPEQLLNIRLVGAVHHLTGSINELHGIT